MNWYLKVIKNYVGFSGRARRKEFWMFVLFHFIISIVLGLIDSVLFKTAEGNIGILGLVYTLAVFLPGLAVAVRRLHDIGKAGWWVLLSLIPIIGIIILIIFYVKEGDSGDNSYGASPK